MEAHPQLAAVAFGLGIVAILWLFRRTLLRVARYKNDPDEQAYRLRRQSAGLAIDDISAREWLVRYRGSMLLGRTALPTTEQAAQLAELSAWQAGVRRKP